MKTDKKVDPRLDKIARATFPDDGLEVKNWDNADFAETSKGELRRMLEEAYKLGKEDGKASLSDML